MGEQESGAQELRKIVETLARLEGVSEDEAQRTLAKLLRSSLFTVRNGEVIGLSEGYKRLIAGGDLARDAGTALHVGSLIVTGPMENGSQWPSMASVIEKLAGVQRVNFAGMVMMTLRAGVHALYHRQ